MNTPASSSSRVDVVDALRGFAILAIMLLHNIEHFDFYFFPDDLPAWVKHLDGIIWDSLFFLFSGKAYAIFALLFGFTFFVQFNNQVKRGKDFGGRFAWRLVLLLLFGIVNSFFYQGDILALYALLGFALIPVRHWINTAVIIAALVLLLQPLEWLTVISILSDPSYVAPPLLSNVYFTQTGTYLAGNSFVDLVWGNLSVGRWAAVFWSMENGRFFQTVALFLAGMVLGRTGKFHSSEQNVVFWKRALLFSAAAFVPLYLLRTSLSLVVPREVLAQKLSIIIASWSNIAFMTLLVSLFVLMYCSSFSRRFRTVLNPLGRMSLTNYVMQSVIGSFVYYGYGLGMYRYTGAAYSAAIGLLLCALQIAFCRWWMKSHTQGPLERIWHRATWMKWKGE